jgi:hypothetical protein
MIEETARTKLLAVAGLRLPILLEPSFDRSMQLSIDVRAAVGTTAQMIAHVMPAYWRWIAEGKPKRFNEMREANEPGQFYYNSYEDHIEVLGDGLYRFSIKLSDGPEGDEWIDGEFRIDGKDIVVTKERSYVS